MRYLKTAFQIASTKRLPYQFMPISLRVAGTVIKEFLEATGSHINGFPTAAGKFMRKSAKNCQTLLLSETL
jgi:hypothetical protein